MLGTTACRILCLLPPHSLPPCGAGREQPAATPAPPRRVPAPPCRRFCGELHQRCAGGPAAEVRAVRGEGRHRALRTVHVPQDLPPALLRNVQGGPRWACCQLRRNIMQRAAGPSGGDSAAAWNNASPRRRRSPPLRCRSLPLRVPRAAPMSAPAQAQTCSRCCVLDMLCWVASPPSSPTPSTHPAALPGTYAW